jgi:acetyl-CoA C-acetyltransferase
VGAWTAAVVTRRDGIHIAGAYEHPQRTIPDTTVPRLHAEVALAALADAGLGLSDVDGFCSVALPGIGGVAMADYLGIRPTFIDTTEAGGASTVCHIGHAAEAIAAGRCNVVLVTMAGLAKQPRKALDTTGGPSWTSPEAGFETPYGPTTAGLYALAARRHMAEFGTTSAQLAAVKVAASNHAQHNPNAVLRNPVTVDDVLSSPMIADPLHRLDCCLRTDGGGAVVLVSNRIARNLGRRTVKVLGFGESPKHTDNGHIDLTYTGGVYSGPAAFAEAEVTPDDIDYASIYDSFTITVIEAIEDLGFCKKGQGGPFAAAGELMAGGGRLPVNTDGGGLCNNHPDNRGGMVKTVEAVRQLRGEAHPQVQVPDCELAIAHAVGGQLGTRAMSATLVLGREDG